MTVLNSYEAAHEEYIKKISEIEEFIKESDIYLATIDNEDSLLSMSDDYDKFEVEVMLGYID